LTSVTDIFCQKKLAKLHNRPY